MRTSLKVLAIMAALGLSAAPAIATADKPSENGKGPQYETPPPNHGKGPHGKAKAYGRYCQGESKKHVKGEKGTPFSQCVTAMAKLDHGTETNPAKACASLSRKHVKGAPGTPFSLCVKGGEKLLA
jgi:hypothetical protein